MTEAREVIKDLGSSVAVGKGLRRGKIFVNSDGDDSET